MNTIDIVENIIINEFGSLGPNCPKSSSGIKIKKFNGTERNGIQTSEVTFYDSVQNKTVSTIIITSQEKKDVLTEYVRFIVEYGFLSEYDGCQHYDLSQMNIVTRYLFFGAIDRDRNFKIDLLDLVIRFIEQMYDDNEEKQEQFTQALEDYEDFNDALVYFFECFDDTIDYFYFWTILWKDRKFFNKFISVFGDDYTHFNYDWTSFSEYVYPVSYFFNTEFNIKIAYMIADAWRS